MRSIAARPSDPRDCLAGGGNMGALMRAFDWSTTALGAVEVWPQSLRTAVSIVLASRFPMIILWGRDFIQLYNDAYRPVLGATKHPASLGQRCQDCWHEIWDTMLAGMCDDVMNGGEPIWREDLELSLDRNGYLEETYFTFSYSAILDESGAPGGILATCVETTERILGERRLRTLRELAAHAMAPASVEEICEGAVSTLANNPLDLPFALVYLLDGDRRARLVSRTGLEAGHPAAPAIVEWDGEPALSRWPFGRAVSEMGAALVTGLGERFGFCPGGPWPEATDAAVLTPIAQRGHAVAGMLVTGISPRRLYDSSYQAFFELVASQIATAIAAARTYEAERERAEALAQIDRAKTAFFSNVSHEFRTPLTLILGSLTELLQDADRTPESAALESAHRNSLRLLKLVNTLLDFSRIEAGRMHARFEPVDLAGFTRDLSSAFRSAMERAGLTFRIECDPIGEPVHVDRDMWEKIVLNLLSNAFKFTFSGGITVSLRKSGRFVELGVRDTGTGIPEHEVPRIFDRFHRVEGAAGRTHEGSGIGLALVQELVRLHRGEINVASRVNEGTTFTVAIPISDHHVALEGQPAKPRSVPTVAGSTAYVEEALRWLPQADPGRTRPAATPAPVEPLTSAGEGAVLVADDNADMRDYVSRLLEPHWRVTVAGDGVDALRAARSQPPDVIVADVMMPRLDGLGLVAALKADETTRNIPVIIVTARAGEDARIEGWTAGADDYLEKPFSARDLIARVNAQIVKARVRTFEQAHVRELERRVMERTFDLSETNAALARALAERTALERARDAWVQTLIDAQEDERTRVARELHDEMGQHLTLLSIGLSALEPVRPDAATPIAALHARIVEFDRSLRRLARALRPPVLDHLGVAVAGRALVRQWSTETGIAADFSELNWNRELSPSIETTLYRVIQEALTNIARHAQARRASVLLERTSDHVVLTVEDDGHGFDVGRVSEDGEMRSGILGIRERAALLGGTAVIDSAPGLTRLVVTLPVSAASSPAGETAAGYDDEEFDGGNRIQ